mmetsp:Transcript_56523/g.103327  ORF Transcript_56523/g.103327 Transcript_56523/m.103327 type:complete len:256 (+) Transcript_56523:388-1155(+)
MLATVVSCLRMHVLLVAGKFKAVLPSLSPTCDVSKRFLVAFRLVSVAALLTLSPTRRASFDILWLSMRWRPAMLTTAPGATVPAAVAYMPTAAFICTKIGTLCSATSVRTLVLIVLASTLSKRRELNVLQRLLTTLSWVWMADVGGVGIRSADEPAMSFFKEALKRLMVAAMFALLSVVLMPLATRRNSLDIFWLSMRWRPAMLITAVHSALVIVADVKASSPRNTSRVLRQAVSDIMTSEIEEVPKAAVVIANG